ncbi:MAG TPA: ribonuclease P protein component, partial [Bacillota bacterium]|nr:ribonuclease P protein component [Bacillota bacterium]
HRKGAVARNRAKRLLREAYRPLSTRIMPGNDVIFLMRVTEPMPSFKDVSAEMERLLLRLKILSSEAME